MSTSVLPVPPASPIPTTAPTPSPAAPGTPSGSATPTAPTAPTDEPFRFGTTAPQWAQGKTAEEVLGLAQQMEQAIRTMVTQSKAPEAPVPSAAAPAFDNDAYITGSALNAQAPRLIEDAVKPHMDALYSMAADGNLASVRRDQSDMFNRYGPEIYGKLGRVPKHLWTVDNLNEVVNMVKANHVDDLARLRAEQMVSEMGGTLRSTGAALPSASQPVESLTLKSDKLPSEWKARAAEVGLTEAALDEFCRSNDMTREQYFGQFGRQTITEVTRAG